MWSIGEGNGKPLQYSCLENPMNKDTLLGHKKEQNWVICRDVNEPNICHTEGS